MSLDNLRLSAFVVQELFQKSLVENNTNKISETVNNSATLNVLGANNQQISVVVNHPEVEFITDDHLTFLTGILNACRLSIEDIALINIAHYPELSYKTLRANVHSKVVLLFGVSPQKLQLPLAFPEFQKQMYDQQTYLAAPPLQILQDDKEAKRKLWNILKEIFEL